MRTDIDIRTPGGLRVTGITTGPGTPDTPLLVCLPGGSYTARYFDVPGFSLLGVAEANGFTAIALDRPGYGGSDPLPAGERTFARSAEILDEAIAALWAEHGAGHPGVVMISHSIGSAST
jgi:pimeloyl-ACP methyl ester carboxylesterase